MKPLRALAAALLLAATAAQAQYVVNVPTQTACISAASAAGGTCLVPYAPPGVPANPFPNGETLSVACASPTVGTWTQTRSYALVSNAWVAGAWSPTTAPAGACATPVATTSDGMTPAMWADIATQRVAFGDPNDCKARVDAVPTTGFTLAPGGNVITALASNATVLLQTGTYKPTGARLDINTGKRLVAAPGAKPVLDLSAMTNFAVIYVGDSTVLAGIEIKGAQGMSIITYDASKGHYSNAGLLYNLKIHDSGRTGSMDDGSGIAISGGSNAGQGQNWCGVSLEVFNSWNPCCAAPTSNGGNSDGISSKFGAGQTTLINVNSHHNGDDGVDMWQGGASYHYFGNYHDNGKVPGVTNGGDGNGIKLGTGNVAHKFYKTTATNNRTGGFNLNGNTMQPVLVQSTASGNPGGDYINGMNAP